LISRLASLLIEVWMGNWKKRMREIAARNPDALPAWLRSGSRDEAWYRVSWQSDAGVDLEGAARPALMLLDWLARKGQLTRDGVAVLAAAHQGQISDLAISRSMVQPKGATFLDQQWESWWETHGINLAMSSKCAKAALAGIEECWRLFGTGS
jgi:hypothetical protein